MGVIIPTRSALAVQIDSRIARSRVGNHILPIPRCVGIALGLGKPDGVRPARIITVRWRSQCGPVVLPIEMQAKLSDLRLTTESRHDATSCRQSRRDFSRARGIIRASAFQLGMWYA